MRQAKRVAKLMAQASDPARHGSGFLAGEPSKIRGPNDGNAAQSRSTKLAWSRVSIDVDCPSSRRIVECRAERRRIAEYVKEEIARARRGTQCGVVRGRMRCRYDLHVRIRERERRTAELIAIPRLQIQKGRVDRARVKSVRRPV